MQDIGESSLFPRQAAGYARGKLLMYDPDVVDLSIAYDRHAPELEHAVTLYFYPRRRDGEAEFTSAKGALTRVHAGARLVSERAFELAKNGQPHRGLLATFEFEDDFAGRRQPVSSQLLVVELPRRMFKARTTAPAAQAQAAEAGLLALLEQVAWDNDPD